MIEFTLTTAVPGITITEAGLSVPDTGEILSGRLTDLANALGGDMSRELTTPQGQIASTETEIIAEMYDRLLTLFNQINPDFAAGRFQDAIGRIYFLDRIAGRGTVVTATCTGLPNTFIPSGSLAQDVNGYQYVSLSDAIIPQSGKVDVVFQCETIGAVVCGAGELNQIYRGVSGWSAIYNTNAGVTGNVSENRASFEARRKRSVAANSRNLDQSLQAALLAVTGVTDAYVWSNRKSVTVNQGATHFPVAPHSVYICVYGGAKDDIAQAIFLNKAPGCDMNGDTQAIVYQTEGYTKPFPEYDIQWQTAKPTTLYFRVKLENSETDLPDDTASAIRGAIKSTFNGEDGINSPASIGSLITAGRYYSGVSSVNIQSLNVSSIELSRDNRQWSSSVTLGIDEVPVVSDESMSVVFQ